MGKGRKATTLDGKSDADSQSEKYPSSSSIRGLAKKDLGGVISGCTNATMKECLEKSLFGLTARHMEYVKHIRVGFPLFLFNYSNRTLSGIFTAASNGRWNIDPHGWTSDPSTKTKFPAQVRVSTEAQYRSIREREFKPYIAANYYRSSHFFFELEHEQVSSLVALFEAHGFKRTALPKVVQCDEPESKNESGDEMFTSEGISVTSELSEKLDQALDSALEEEASTSDDSEKLSSAQLDQARKTPSPLGDDDSGLLGTLNNEKVAMLVQKVLEQDNRINRLEERLIQSDRTIEQLCDQVKVLTTKFTGTSNNQLPWCGNLNPTETIFVVGGINGNGSLFNLGAYLPIRDNLISLAPPSSPRISSAVTCLNGILYTIGGRSDASSPSVETVESYSPATNSWSTCPSLTCGKDYLAGASLQGKLFVFGGLGMRTFSDVEMYDPALGRWVVIGSMLQERFAHSVIELNGAIYVSGGYDMNNCLQTVERYDPRDACCVRLRDMLTRRACHS